MNAASISSLVDKSLAGPREIYTAQASDPAEYVSSIKMRFVEKRIAPKVGMVLIERHVMHLLGLPEGEHVVYFVTMDDPQSVFFDPNTNSFGCAWGPDSESGRFVDLGFRSADVLAMASA